MGDRRRAGALTVEQVYAVIDGCPSPRDRALISLLYFYGLRVTEGVTLRMDAVSQSKIEIHRGKGSVSGTWPMLPRAWMRVEPWLRVRIAFSEYLFPGKGGKGHLTRRQAQNIVVAACLRAGIDEDLARTHILKHSIITHLVGRVPPAAAQRWVGHRSGRVFEKYVEWKDIPLDEAEAALK